MTKRSLGDTRDACRRMQQSAKKKKSLERRWARREKTV
jgi:hypothetical protein